MPLYVVVCQDAAGHREPITVDAPTETTAYEKALAELNSWRAISALPVTSSVRPAT